MLYIQDILYIDKETTMKQISLRLDESQYNELKDLSEIYNMDYSQIIREGIDAVNNPTDKSGGLQKP